MAQSDVNATLLPGERVVISSDSGVLTVTNFRVRLDASGSSASRYLSITLDTVASSGVVTRTRPLFLAVAAISGIAAIAVPAMDLRVVLLFLTLCFAIAYRLTKSAMLTISSAGGEHIAVPAKGIGRERIIEFFDAVDAAKLEFIGAQHGGRPFAEQGTLASVPASGARL